ncbi:NACHT domain-containing protein [Cellulomonas hominis]|uniref:NACHT domain-containing protein n=1 Tax=Cellulomonas hominis TaxID=156981 RepID=UPI001443A7E0|nr:hypothetical protein [Cellulomonas hominis]NKY08908.1 hypothetical protein [Cellulomonas hominis]
MRKRVDFSCPGRAFRKWLRSITPEELATPVEDIHGQLAKRLDDDLAGASRDWASADDHLSRALRLVELTYPAITAALGDSDRTALSEAWAQQRSASVRDRLLQMAGTDAALSSEDLAIVLRQRSAARRAVRLQAFDIDEAALAALLDEIAVPVVPTSGVLVLLGDFGSGKSETAEAWHRGAVEMLTARRDAPIPVWLNASDAVGQTLEAAISAQVGPTWRHGRGASIALDGLDETDPATAQGLLEAARVLAKTYANIRILLTARPGILQSTEKESAEAALLTEPEALKLIELAAGSSRATWHWTPDMRATVTRPFFALAAGVMLGRDEAPRGEADLLRSLVEGALAKGTERSVVTSSETRSALESLAVALTRTGRDGLNFSDRQIARSSRLVTDAVDGSVRFSLPIFQHWFAAQAILAGSVPAAEVVLDAVSFNRWRWATAVAALSAPDADVVDDLLGAWVAGNPGAAAWIIREAFGGHRDWRREGDAHLDGRTSGARLLRALRTWSDALGALAKGVLPAPVVSGPVGLGVSVSGHRIDVAFSVSRPAADYVTEVPSGVHPLRPAAAPDWRPWMSGAAPRGDAWPWTIVRSTIADATAEKLSLDPYLGAPEGIWVQERRFDLARRLLNQGSLFHGALRADQVRQRAAEVFESIGRDRRAQVSIRGSASFSGAELEDLISWLGTTSAVQLVSHLPEEDILRPSGHWIWDFYSPQRLLEFEAEVYGRACEAYDEALAHSFARLGWSMPGSALAPFGAVMELQYRNTAEGDRLPGLTVFRVPMALLPQLAPTRVWSLRSTSGRAAIRQVADEEATDWTRHASALETVRSWLAEQNLEPLGGLGVVHTGTDDMSEPRPASTVAGQWLWEDLERLGLGAGTFRRLR